MTTTKPKTAKDRRDAQVTFRITFALRQQIEVAAARDRRSVSTWVLLVLEDALKSGRSFR